MDPVSEPPISLAEDAGIWQAVAEMTDQDICRVKQERETLLHEIDALANQLQATPHAPVADTLRGLVRRHAAA